MKYELVGRRGERITEGRVVVGWEGGIVGCPDAGCRAALTAGLDNVYVCVVGMICQEMRGGGYFKLSRVRFLR